MYDISKQWLEEVQSEIFEKSKCPEYDLLVKYSEKKLKKRFNHKIESHLLNCKLCDSVVNGLSDSVTNKQIENDSKEVILAIENNYSPSIGFGEKIINNIRKLYSVVFDIPVLKYSAFAVSILIISAIASHNLFKPKYYELAKFNPSEKEMILLSVDNLRGEEATEVTPDISMLLENETSFLGFIPKFDNIRLQNSLELLTQIYNSDTDPFYKEKYAYFIGKTYLMKADRQNAVKWFTKVTEFKSETLYSKLANRILSELN